MEDLLYTASRGFGAYGMIALIAVLIGGFWRHSPGDPKLRWRRRLLVWFETLVFVWIFGAVASLTLLSIGVRTENVWPLGGFLIPLVFGAWFARVRFQAARESPSC